MGKWVMKKMGIFLHTLYLLALFAFCNTSSRADFCHRGEEVELDYSICISLIHKKSIIDCAVQSAVVA